TALPWLAPRPREQALVVALQQAVETAGDEQLEPPEDLLRVAVADRRREPGGGRHQAPRTSRGGRPGSGTGGGKVAGPAAVSARPYSAGARVAWTRRTA